ETFVVREIAALRSLGIKIKAFCLYPPDDRVVHPEAPELARAVEVLFRPARPSFWWAHLFFLLRHPRRYWHCLVRYGLRAPEPWRQRRRCLAFFLAAPYAAWRLRRAGVQHLHAHFANAPASLAMPAAHLAGISFSFTVHAYDLFIDQLLLPAKLEAAAFVASISRFNLGYLQANFSAVAARARLELVRNGIDPERFRPRPHPIGTPPLVLAVGRLVETKGFHLLVAACAQLRQAGRDCHCLIVGEGPEAEGLKKMVKDLGLEDRVELPGRLQPEELLPLFQRADLLAMPSCVRQLDQDGIPTVLIEALAMEIPVVATRVSGIPELVKDGETGLLVDPDDLTGLVAALERLLADRSLAQRLAAAGRKLVVAEFNSQRSAARMLKLFGEAINSKRKLTENRKPKTENRP
ncbi:MAG: glycosyltransferase family 4 protein, partial [Deltaproteobacteria bacterium]|nr:glycosyltransferase family 4 protein [Deltaproteobacteria bacterium]